MICKKISKKNFPSKCSNGQVECSFDKPAGKNFARRPKSFAQYPKTITKNTIFSIRKFPQKKFLLLHVFKVAKIKMVMEKQSNLKKSFLSQRHLYRNGKAQNMPVVAGRFLNFSSVHRVFSRKNKTTQKIKGSTFKKIEP